MGLLKSLEKVVEQDKGNPIYLAIFKKKIDELNFFFIFPFDVEISLNV